jgi:sec-independent protein translocase protein TatC
MSEDDSLGEEQSFLSHLFELRSRLLRMVATILAFAVVLLPFSSKIYALFANPMLEQLPAGSSMIAVEVASPFLAPFKMTLMLAVFLSVPVLLYQAWSFVAPGLYRKEKRIAVPILISSSVLFYVGCAFAYFVVFPLIFAFFSAAAPDGVTVAPDISHYLNFMLVLFFAFGVAFEVPVVVFILVAAGITTPDSLAAKRPYVIVSAFAIGMFLTPPDVISQTLLALPMWVLFEAGIIASRLMLGKQPAEKTASAED